MEWSFIHARLRLHCLLLKNSVRPCGSPARRGRQFIINARTSYGTTYFGYVVWLCSLAVRLVITVRTNCLPINDRLPPMHRLSAVRLLISGTATKQLRFTWHAQAALSTSPPSANKASQSSIAKHPPKGPSEHGNTYIDIKELLSQSGNWLSCLLLTQNPNLSRMN